MAMDVSGNISNQNDLIALCLEYGWDPLFLSKEQINIEWDSFFREVEVCRAAGEWKLCDELLKVVKRMTGKFPVNYSSQLAQYAVSDMLQQSNRYSWFNPLSGLRHLFNKRRVSDALRLVLSGQDLEPQVFCLDSKSDYAEQWGLEMKHWSTQQNHELVIALGNSASLLNLSHPGISQCLEESTLALERTNQQIVLKAIKQSPLRSRSDYEKSILKAWALDPDCDVYLDLLRKVVAFRLRQTKQYGLLADEFRREIVEFEVNKKLVRYLMQAGSEHAS